MWVIHEVVSCIEIESFIYGRRLATLRFEICLVFGLIILIHRP